MTKNQKKKAAKLWAFALVSHSAEEIEEVDDENEVRSLAREFADKELSKMGFCAGELLSVNDCLKVVS